MKRIKMTSQYCGASGTFPPGSELPMDDAEAKQLVEGGYAKYVSAGTKNDESKEKQASSGKSKGNAPENK